MSQSVVTYSLLDNGLGLFLNPLQRSERFGVTVIRTYEMAEYWITQICLNFRFV